MVADYVSVCLCNVEKVEDLRKNTLSSFISGQTLGLEKKNHIGLIMLLGWYPTSTNKTSLSMCLLWN